MKKEHILANDLTHQDICFQYTSVDEYLRWLTVDWLDYVSASIVHSLWHVDIVPDYQLVQLSCCTMAVLSTPTKIPWSNSLHLKGNPRWWLTRRVTTWGTSPKYLAEIQASNIIPSTSPLNELIPENVADLSNLRLVTSTGSVLTSSQTRWVFPSEQLTSSIKHGPTSLSRPSQAAQTSFALVFPLYSVNKSRRRMSLHANLRRRNPM